MKPIALLPTCLALVAGCSHGGSGGSSGRDETRPQTHGDSLAALGVDQSPSPRIDEYGTPLPEDYTPLGGVVRIDPISELWLGGVELKENAAVASLLQDFSENPPDENGVFAPEVLFSLSEDDAPWMKEDLESESFPETKRAAAAADLDGDGIEELVTIFHEGDRIRVLVVEHQQGSYQTHEEVLVFNVPDVRDISVAAGDFDGDRADDLAIGYALESEAWLFFAGLDESGKISLHPQSSMVFHPNFFDSSIELITEAGNLDNDSSMELVVVVNERAGPQPMITSRYHVIDDRATGYQELDSGFVAGFELNQGLRVAGLSDVALGDIDGDYRDEILFGGIEFLARNCSPVPYIMIAMDDATAGFSSMGVKTIEQAYPDCQDFDPHKVRFAHVNALDIDGDGIDEVQVDAFTFDDWASADPWTRVEDWEIPESAFLSDGQSTWLDETNVAFATGDLNADHREDILMWRASYGSPEVSVYGMDAAGEHVVLLGRILTNDTAALVNPILVAIDADRDAPVLQAVGGREFLFGEPIVLAVLAAPPCKAGIGQNTDACQTTFGNTQSSGNEEEATVSFSASGFAGFSAKDPATDSGPQLKATVSRKVSAIASRAYQVEKTVSFTTGPGEDTVVFTTVPMDQFAYRILYHPDPDLIEKVLRVMLPREPIFLQVERGFYNAHVTEEGLKIDSDVFRHHIGNPRSYPTRAEKEDLLVRYGGLEIGPQAVGQGAGETELELAVSEEYGIGGALELGFEVELEVTAGPALGGFSVGASAEAQFMVTSGISTSYSGAVGSIDGEHFLENQYSFGLFTYVQLDPATGQEFEVINYWVE